MAPRLRFLVKLVGIIVFDNAVVQDDIDRAYGFVVLTPALIRETLAVSPAVAAPISYGLQLRHADLTTVEQQIVRLLPKNATVEFHVTSRVVTEVELALKPESVALGGFGAIAALVCLILGIQAISRQLRWTEDDRWVMRALGAGPTAAGRRRPHRRSRCRWPRLARGPLASRSDCRPWLHWDPCAPSTPTPALPSTGRCSVAAWA